MKKNNDIQEQELAPEQLLLIEADAALEQLLQEEYKRMARACFLWLDNWIQELGEDND